MIGVRDWLESPDLLPPESWRRPWGFRPGSPGCLPGVASTDLKAAQGFLDPQYYSPAAPEELPGIDPAASRVRRALERGEHILVWGDFDVDGQTATALLVATLQELGGRVSYHVPVRAQESHGVSPEVLQRWLAVADRPDLVLTCDTGIAAFEAAKIARSAQVDLVITDHHELPRQVGSDQPHLPHGTSHRQPALSAGWSPAGRAAWGRRRLQAGRSAVRTAPAMPERANQHLDLVALGIVADVALADRRHALPAAARPGTPAEHAAPGAAGDLRAR